MSNDAYSDEELKKKYGMRCGGTALFAPQELGYRCRLGHSDLTWSEFAEHVWCYECEKDYHYADDCILIKDEFNPTGLPKQPIVIKGIKNWTEDGDGFNDIPLEMINDAKAKSVRKRSIKGSKSV